ncbi:MAG: WGxxGxxG family protein [Cyanobacteria bacterium J06643_13]
MKFYIRQQAFGGLLALSMAIVPFTASVQAQTDSEVPEIAVIETEDEGFDWGWLGLLGLLGLAGLAGKNKSSDREVVNRDRDLEPFPETTERSKL